MWATWRENVCSGWRSFHDKMWNVAGAVFITNLRWSSEDSGRHYFPRWPPTCTSASLIRDEKGALCCKCFEHFLIIPSVHFQYVRSLLLLSEMAFLNIRASTLAVTSNSNISRIKSFARGFEGSLAAQWMTKTCDNLRLWSICTEGQEWQVAIYRLKSIRLDKCRWIRGILHQPIRYRAPRFLLSASTMDLCRLM